MENNWAVILNKRLGLYIAISSESGLTFIRSEEDLIRTDLTKAQALQLANDFNRLADWIKENK